MEVGSILAFQMTNVRVNTIQTQYTIASVSDVWVKGQPRSDEAIALSYVQKSPGGGGSNSQLVTQQVTTSDI